MSRPLPLFLSLPLALVLAAPAPAGDRVRGEEVGEKTMTGRMVYYSGRVQGVGFRATTADIARGRPVTGWVKNLADGRVQLLVEGDEKDVEAFLQAVRERWKGHIEKEQIEKQVATGKYKGFEIVR